MPQGGARGQNLGHLKKHIGFGLSVRMYVCMYVFMFEISS